MISRCGTGSRSNREVTVFCGIAGYAGLTNESLLRQMIEVLRHRGPDDVGFYSDQGIGLGNARLSIIDLATGHQPIRNEDGTVHVTYNGEIYNFRELRKELELLGHRFYTQSDTEVIVHSYEQFGEDFVSKLNGMFAIAVWDVKHKRLLLARDRMGIKPLYYTIQNDSLLFASEIKGILQGPVERTVDEESLMTILNLGYIPGERTLLKGVHKLPPSSLLVYEDGSARVTTYWQLPPVAAAMDDGSLIEGLERSLQDAVRDQLVADVPVGCFLSGGLDTSTLVAYSSKVLSQPLKTFCMGFGEETDEFRDARLIAETFGTDHHEITVDSSQGVKLYPRMIWHMEAPKYNLYPWFVCELVRRHVKVCLSGNGGDEIFGGYFARYQSALKIERLAKNPISSLLKAAGTMLQSATEDTHTQNRLRVLGALDNHAEEYLILAGALPEAFNHKLFRNTDLSSDQIKRYYSPFFEHASFLQGLMTAELRTKLVDDLLSVDDSMSMAHSLELRVPLLDNRVVDLMVSVPWQMKYAPGTHGKLLLRKAIRRILPEQTFRKPKWGFSVDVYSWYRGELGEVVRQILPGSDAIKRYFSEKVVRRLLQKPVSPRNRRYQVLLWQLLGFHFWHKIFIETERIAAPSLDVNRLVT